MPESALTQLQLPTGGPLPSQVSADTNMLLPSTTVAERLRHFSDEVYDTSPESHLTRFMSVLLGDVGAGQLRKALLRSRLQETINGTHFYALDKFYGALFDFQRSVRELLTVAPNGVSNNWEAEHAKDASYRSRIQQFARAITYGGTPTGMELAAEAVLSVDCDVYESYVQADASYRTYGDIETSYATYNVMEGVAYGALEGEGLPVLAGNDRREFTVRPKREVSQSETYDLTRVLNKLKPADARFRIDWRGVLVNTVMTLRGLASDSEYWEVVTLVPDPNGPPVEPPGLPFSKHQGESWTYNGDVAGVSAYALTASQMVITSALNGKALDVPDFSRDANTPIQMWTPTGGANQLWRVEPVGFDTYRIISVLSGLALDVSQESMINGGPLIQYPWKGTAASVTKNQQFRIQPLGNGYYTITAVHSGLVLDIMNMSSLNGARVQQWASNLGPHQQWAISSPLAPTIAITPVQRVVFPDRSFQDYPPTDAILPLASILAGRIVSDGILVSGVYGGYRPNETLFWQMGGVNTTISAVPFLRAIANILVDFIPLELMLLWFRDNPINPMEFTASRHFWVSPVRRQEDKTIEYVEVRLTEPKLVNNVKFETSRYPHVVGVQYYNEASGQWVDVYRKEVTESFPAFTNAYQQGIAASTLGGKSVGHLEHPHSATNHWVVHDLKFAPVTTSRVRVSMQRGPGQAPISKLGWGIVSPKVTLPYSLAVRKQTIGYRIDSYDDLLPFKNPAPIAKATNFVGQAIRFAGRHQAASGLLANPQQPWRCEPQPFNYAVVNLFLDARDQAGQPSTIDRFYMDPTHPGCHVTIYWSNDDGAPDYTVEHGGQTFFDSIAWNPIPRDYTAQKGFLHLPPTRAKWFKFEFTNLVAEPYEVFVPVRRVVRIFSPATVAETKLAATGVGDEGRPQGLTSAIAMNQDYSYADAVEVLATESQTRSSESPTSAFYVREPGAWSTLRDQSWAYGFTPFTQGTAAPRFARYERHVYQEVELFNTSKVAFFCGLNKLVPYRVDHTASDDTNVYTDTLDDFLHIEPGFTWTFNPGSMTSGASSNVVAVSRPMQSLHNVRAIQFATQQSDPIQLIPDDEFQDEMLSSTNWKDTDNWHKVGDAQLLYRATDTTVRTVRRVDATSFLLDHVPGVNQPVPYPVFAETAISLEDVAASAATFGGIASGMFTHSVAGRVHAAARVIIESELTNPLVLQIVKSDGTVLAEALATGRTGERREWDVGWTIPEGVTGDRAIRVQLIQRGKSNDQWRVDTLSLFDDGVVWDFSVNGGVNWYPAPDIRNNAYGILTFPAAGNQLVWRCRGVRANVSVSAIRIRPIYVGVANSRQDGTHRGPNVSTYDHEPPIQDDPWFNQWSNPIPRGWFFASKSLPTLPVAGAPNVTRFSRYYSRPVDETLPTPTDGISVTILRARNLDERMDFYNPITDTVSRAGSVFRRGVSESVPEPTDVATRVIIPTTDSVIVSPPVHPVEKR